MKKLLKWLIPCLVACFMGLGLCFSNVLISANGGGQEPDSNQVTVTFHYVDLNNEKKIADSDTKIFDSGEKVNAIEHAKDIEGYTYKNADPESYTVVAQKDKDINLYYEANDSSAGNVQTFGSKPGTLEDVLQPDQSFIVVTKTFDGLTGDQIGKLENFAINVKNEATQEEHHLQISNDMVPSGSDTKWTYTWKINNTGTATYTVSETGYEITDYNVTPGGNVDSSGTGSVTVSAKELTNSSIKLYNGSSGGGTYYINKEETENTVTNQAVVLRLGTGNGPSITLVITDEEISYSERLAIYKVVHSNGVWSDPYENYAFYSVDQIRSDPGFTLIGNDDEAYYDLILRPTGASQSGRLKYYPKTGKIEIGKNQFNGSGTLTYSYSSAINGDVNIVNTYTPATKKISVEKQWLYKNGDKFANSPEESVTVSLGKIVGNQWNEIPGSRKDLSTSENEAENWKCSWSVPIYDVDGEAIIYQVRELDASENPIENNGTFEATNNTYTVTYAGNSTDEDPTNGNEAFTVKNTFKPGSLTISKNVSGAFGDKNKKFEILVSLKDASDQNIKKQLTVSNSEDPLNYDESKKGYVLSLSHGESVTIQGLGNVSYTVSENAEGYEISFNESDQSKKDMNSITGEIKGDNKNVKVNNHKEAVPLTGITDNTPKGLGLIGSIVVEIAAIAFVLKKKRQLKM